MNTVLLDGLMGAPWRLRGMQKYLRRRGITPVEIFAYDSSGRRPIEELAGQIREFCGEEPVQVVAHSMGGLIVRTAKMLFPDWELEKVAFICVPHNGSMMARLLPLAGIRQMRPGSELLCQLAQSPWEVPTLSVWCPGDLMVFPGSSARWPATAREIRCDFPLHNWPVVSSTFHRQIADFFLQS